MRLKQIGYFSLSLLALLVLVVGVNLGAAETKNGFDLSDSSLPVESILSGGPPRDGIPAIDKPRFAPASEVDFLQPEDRVLGVSLRGVQRAYPIRILNWHEIVNDSIDGQGIVVTYCPLCGTGVVFESAVGGSVRTFGVSGLLYNSDVLLYDRESESLWSQILAEAVSGEMRGEKLQSLPVSHTSWREWRKRFPGTQVLTMETGFSRDYSRSPYAGYDSNESIYFPLAAESRRYHPKERVLGLTLNNSFKAYPFAELAKLDKNTLVDEFAGEKVVVEYDVENRDGRIMGEGGEQLAVVNSFWFAWYAFHPEGEVYQAPEVDR